MIWRINLAFLSGCAAVPDQRLGCDSEDADPQAAIEALQVNCTEQQM